MKKSIHEIITEQIQEAPQALLNTLISDSFSKNIQAVTSLYSLDTETTTAIEEETALLILGIEPLEDFESNLIEHAHITNEQAISIGPKIFSQIITPIESEWYQFLKKQLKEASEDEVFEESENKTDVMRTLLRENSKTVNIKNIIDNID